MDIIVSVSIGIALSMDCLAVASCYGINFRSNNRLMIELGIYFGIFQASMIISGGLLGSFLIKLIYQYAKWVSAILLIGIAVKMFIEGLKGEKSCYEENRLTILYLAFATSVDALLVGLAFSVIKDSLYVTALIVGLVCFIITIAGFIAGKLLKRFIGSYAEFFGAVILFIIALKAIFSS